MVGVSDDSDAAGLLAADVLALEARLARATQELRIVREMLSEVLAIAHLSLVHIASWQAR